MNRNTVEIIIMWVVLVVLMIGMVFVIKTKYMPEVDEVNDYSYDETIDTVDNSNVENTTVEVSAEENTEVETNGEEAPEESNVAESEQ